MRRRRCLPRFTFSCSNYHQAHQHSCLQVGKKFSDMQTAIGRRSKEKALKVVEAQQQVSMLEAEVEEMERRREIKLEQGEAMYPLYLHQKPSNFSILGEDLKRVRVLQGPVEMALQQVVKEIRVKEGLDIMEGGVDLDITEEEMEEELIERS